MVVFAINRHMKNKPHDENEVHDIVSFQDRARAVVTAVGQLPPDAMAAHVQHIKSIVQSAHKNSAHLTTDEDGIIRAQIFEEGQVFMLEKPFGDFPTDRYLMDFYDTREKGICSRMHVHTGTRFVRIMTGADTSLRISSLSEMDIKAASQFHLSQTIDDMPDMPSGSSRIRYSVVVPPNSIVDMQIPSGTSHQFNADGPNSVIDSVHPEESLEVFREQMERPNMMAQTVFLANGNPDYPSCASRAGNRWSAPFAAAAGLILFSLSSYFGASALHGHEIKKFQQQNPSAIEIKFNRASAVNLADATFARMAMNPKFVYLSPEVFKTIKAGKSNVQSLAWANNQTILRQSKGEIEGDQTVFEYLVADESRARKVRVTPENTGRATAELQEILGL